MDNVLDLIDVEVQYHERFIDSADFARIVSMNKRKVILIKTLNNEWSKIEVDRTGAIKVSTGSDGPLSAGITHEEISAARRDKQLRDLFKDVTGNIELEVVYTLPYSKRNRPNYER